MIDKHSIKLYMDELLNNDLSVRWGGKLPDKAFNSYWKSSLPGFKEKWLETLCEMANNDSNKMKDLLRIFQIYRFVILNEALDNEYDIQNRLNYKGDFIRKKFALYRKEFPNKKKTQLINDLAKDLGITTKGVEKHIYKK